jgi:predicted dehydrogenase
MAWAAPLGPFTAFKRNSRFPRTAGLRWFVPRNEIATNEKQKASGVIDEFADCLVKNKPPRISGEEGLKSLNVILAAFESQ